MRTWFIIGCLLASITQHPEASETSTLLVRITPLWNERPLERESLTEQNAGERKLSVTRLSALLSHAELQQGNGQWIGAANWVAFVDLASNRLAFELNNIPAGQYQALRFDIGLDEKTDRTKPENLPPGHALHPDVNGLHWSWRGQYVFVAVEGRYQSKDGVLGGYSFHLAGQPCRGTVAVPAEIDLRQNMALSLNLHVDRFFNASHRIDVAKTDSTHSADGDELAPALADNAVRMFGFAGIAPGSELPLPNDNNGAWKPDLMASRIPAHFPQVRFPADNPITEAGAALGRRLFHDARLSVNNSLACAGCHLTGNALADPRPLSIGAEGRKTARNAMPLFNLAWKPAYFWDGRSPTLRDQVLQPIQDHNEMDEKLERLPGKLQDLAPQFEAAFGTPEINADRIAKALEQHLLTLISGNSKMDRTVTSGESLSPQEQRGFVLFFTESDPARGIRGADCFHCHGGAHFTNHQFLNNGLDDDQDVRDEGLAKQTGKPLDRGRFMVPTLRNVALTAPYMHDGRFATLEEVIDHYDHGVKASPGLDPNLAKQLRRGGLGLSKDDKAALIAFLKTLTDGTFAGQ